MFFGSHACKQIAQLHRAERAGDALHRGRSVQVWPRRAAGGGCCRGRMFAHRRPLCVGKQGKVVALAHLMEVSMLLDSFYSALNLDRDSLRCNVDSDYGV